MGSEVDANSSQGTKTKIIRDDEWPSKLAETSESEGEKETQNQLPTIVESASEGVFDRLKKVEIIQDDEWPSKVAKSSEPEGIQRQPPAIVKSASEGVFDRLKKVEDLVISICCSRR